MNSVEQRMVEILKELRESYGALAVRAEFEAEGTRLEELLRLKEICMTAGLGLTLKIGGCESIRDMLEAKIVGVDYLVAPMVESPYALRKYLQAVSKTFFSEEANPVEVLCNIETVTGCDNFEAMLEHTRAWRPQRDSYRTGRPLFLPGARRACHQQERSKRDRSRNHHQGKKEEPDLYGRRRGVGGVVALFRKDAGGLSRPV